VLAEDFILEYPYWLFLFLTYCRKDGWKDGRTEGRMKGRKGDD
jgi:hypothetical protein